MDTLQEYEKELERWRELMKDQAANALALNVLGEELYFLKQELIAQGIAVPDGPTTPPPNPEDVAEDQIV